MADMPGRQSALAAFDERFRAASSSDVAVREVSVSVQIGLRGDLNDAGFLAAAKNALACDLPVAPCSVARGGGGRKVLWLGPDEWLVVDEKAQPSLLIERLRRGLAGRHAAVVELSMNRLVIALSGPMARSVLEKMCLHDLHPRAFGPGRVVGTVMFKTQVLLEQVDETPSYWLYVRPSFSRGFADLLIDAMAEFGR